ncbi:hypothetical protein C4572_02875 [Candidatus Parcubacteria bacterium]|nr:MAG: hypothetical protein C4572_02875 [Candidatus Parcubacteria bacterium]
MKKFFILTISSLAVAAMAVLVWYSPVLFKGYNPTVLGISSLQRANNLAQAGVYSSENQLNVILSSDLIGQEGMNSAAGSKFSAYIFSYIIKFFGRPSLENVILINSIILALAMFFFSLAVYLLFGFEIFFIFSILYIFIPANWFLPQDLVGYQFGILFLSLFILTFAIGNNSWQGNGKNTWVLAVAGIFLALSGLSKEALMVFLPVLMVYLLWRKMYRQLSYIFIPAVAVIGIFWLPDFFSGKNIYLLNFTGDASSQLKSADTYYAELFPDSYTYHFDKDAYLKRTSGETGSDFISSVALKKQSSNIGQARLGFFERLKVGTVLFVRHIFRFVSFEEIGGPFVLLFMVLGIYRLKKERNYYGSFLTFWPLASIFLMSFVVLVGRNHLVDFGFPITLLLSLGVSDFSKMLKNQFHSNKSVVVLAITCLLVIYSLVLADRAMWSRFYNNNNVMLLKTYQKEILKGKKTGVIATPLGLNDAYSISYNTDSSIITFNPKTVENLLSEGKLSEVFEKYRIRHILGYSPELSKKINELTGVEIIADDGIVCCEDEVFSANKSWFLNLIK